MNKATPCRYGQTKAARLQPFLTNILTALAEQAPKLGESS
mgnify:CR=1 FL=1